MKLKKNPIARFVGVLIFGLLSVHANAFSVWAVQHGADPSSNSAGNTLVLPAGSTTIDLYFDTDGDISLGWDILLTVSGSGLISNVRGGDINEGLGVSQPDGGSDRVVRLSEGFWRALSQRQHGGAAARQ